MTDSNRESEAERRETASVHRGDVEEGSGEKLAPKRMSQMVSVRLEGDVVAAVRDIAERRGMTVSDVLREAVGDLVAAESSGGRSVMYFEVKTGAKEHNFRSSDYETGAWWRARSSDDDDLVRS